MTDLQKNIVIAAATAAVGLIIGGLIGHFATKVSDQDVEKISMMDRLVADKWEEDHDLNQKMINRVDPQNLRMNLKELTQEPHLAGTQRDDYLAQLLQTRFKEAGFDTSDLVPYYLLLSRPNSTNHNQIFLLDGDTMVFASKYKEEALHPNDNHPEFIDAFSAYTPAGNVMSEKGEGVIYVNYGRVEDFDELDTLGINVTDKIVMARYGKIFRGNKIYNAQVRGANGVILFSDPDDVARDGVEEQEIYPNTFWLPGSGMQRGTTYMGNEGDPLTPGWPSTHDAYRLEIEEAELPKIPCQPIGYDDARVILEKLSGVVPPSEWKGGLENVGYNLGPKFKDEFSNYKVQLQTHNYVSKIRSYNVIATIKGDIEPDRYVLIGNHRDAWGYGASDPSSGTAQLLETARVLGTLLKEGWRPRRTLVFCSWGAEEYGLLGSTEWVEEHVEKLQERAVAYINTDTCASGPILNTPASPLLWDPITKITKMVPGVQSSDGSTIYDELVAYYAKQNKSSPEMKTLGSGSDYAAFSFYCGIPCMDVWFRRDKNKYDISIYPSYHTGYETFYMVSTHVDPEFRIIQGCSRVALLTLRYMADSAVIPYSLDKLPTAMKTALSKIKGKDDNTVTLTNIYEKFPLLEESIDNFNRDMNVFQQKLEKMKNNMDPVTLRSVNDLLMKMEQVFVMPAGLPGRQDIRHAVFAPSQFDSYATAGFPGITDLLYGYKALEGEEKKNREKQIKRHISDLTILVQRASSLLKDFHFI